MRKWQASAKFKGCFLAALTLFGFATAEVKAEPQRVVSINVCTDQLAMLLAKEGQLRSVSLFATDPLLSVMPEQAAEFPLNNAQAEEIYLLEPDLVLASTFSSRTTVGLLRELGLRVEEFEPARNFNDIASQLERMGQLLGQEKEASMQVAAMKEDLATIKRPAHHSRIALYYANGYTSGPGTLIDTVVREAGLRNIAEIAGVSGSNRIPLEVLVMEKPELVLHSSRENGPALAFENFNHPAMRDLLDSTRLVSIDDNLTVCGGSFTVKAVQQLAEAAGE